MGQCGRNCARACAKPASSPAWVPPLDDVWMMTAGVKFFSVMLETQPSESIIFKGLQQFAKNCSFIKSVEVGGAIMATIILK